METVPRAVLKNSLTIYLTLFLLEDFGIEGCPFICFVYRLSLRCFAQYSVYLPTHSLLVFLRWGGMKQDGSMERRDVMVGLFIILAVWFFDISGVSFSFFLFPFEKSFFFVFVQFSIWHGVAFSFGFLTFVFSIFD